MRFAQKLFSVLDPSHKDCVYTTVQLARNFNKPVYKSLPWFLEYKEGKFATEDELRHNSAVKERTECINKSAIVVHAPQQTKEPVPEQSYPAVSISVDKNVQEAAQSSKPSQQEETTSKVGKKRSEFF